MRPHADSSNEAALPDPSPAPRAKLRRPSSLRLVRIAFVVLAAAVPLGGNPTPTSTGRDPMPTLSHPSPSALRAAVRAIAAHPARPARPEILTLIDYTLPSTERRLWVLDLAAGRVLFHELVAHGVNSGEDRPTAFSNTPGSRQSSLGLFLTGVTYQGRNGLSLRLHGLEEGVNDHALDRAIVVHGAAYVSPEFIAEHGRLGRSWGCPALARRVAPAVIKAIADGTLLYIHGQPKAGEDGP